MITEFGLIEVKPGTEKDFELAVRQAEPLYRRAKGALGVELHKSLEKPLCYRLVGKWETLENHTIDFRNSSDFAQWRAMISPYLAALPEVDHTETLVSIKIE
jgi:heme-degrading monooxygenase HmoA